MDSICHEVFIGWAAGGEPLTLSAAGTPIAADFDGESAWLHLPSHFPAPAAQLHWQPQAEWNWTAAAAFSEQRQ